ncbi:SusC/RagA family TonB-linked outer membrane protein [Mucilaginibacter kameinonensis]|uniref:SusC/RagA family TonB-linked outer membrane protein n=1 Tax=Mucilaginibacter kameinonensis TaxID=452286 RepID=UPI000EF7F6B7|nr:TonB-dependent receptor [Mucilaginibacter kameinonensis]
MMKLRPPINMHASTLAGYTLSRCWGKTTFKFAMILLFIIGSYRASAQNHLVSGRVIDSLTLQGVSGATIKIKNTTKGTVANPDGSFKIEVAAGAILEISAVNYHPVEVKANQSAPIQIMMASINKTLADVVVIGYGTAKRSDVTGSVSSVPKARLSEIPAPNVLQAMEGTVAGVNITTGTNAPGESPSIVVRGVNTITGSTDPLIVIDGTPFQSLSLNDINTNDIASIDILKDVSATAIYGTRGANGVLLITTKHGKAGKASISFSNYAGPEYFAHKVKPMGPAEYVQKYADYKLEAGVDNNFPVPNQYEQENYAAGKTTDWLKEISQQGFIQDHNLSITGGGKDVRYFVSGDYFREKGLLKGFQNKRGSIRSNIDATLASFLTVGANLYMTLNNFDGGRVNLQQAMQMSPYGRFKDPDGNYTIFPMSGDLAFQSPMLGLTTTRNDRRENFITNVYAEVKPLAGLKYRVNASYNYLPTLYQYYQGRLAGDITNGSATVSNGERNNWVVENILTYEKNWNKHHIDFTGLYSAQQNREYSSTLNASGFINDALQFNALQGASTFSASSSYIKTTIVSQMARINYSYDSRYLITATARRDGYSAFGSNTNKYGTFPSVAIAWNVSNESFMKKAEFIDNLKLRGSYGLSGNQSAVVPNSTVTTFSTTSIPSGGKPTTGIVADILGNSDLKWESTYGANIGIDFSLFKGRISGTIEGYKTTTKNLVLYRQLPAATGYLNIVSNVGKVGNKGIEVTLRTQNIVSGDFRWETNFNFAANNNKILDLYGDKKDDIGNRLFIGKPIYVIYDYKQVGVWKVGEDPSKQDPGAIPGDLKFADLDHNGVITSDGKDQTILGQSTPKWTGGVTSAWHYKNFHLSVFIQTVQGVTKYNQLTNFVDYGGRQNVVSGLGYWTPTNQSDVRPSINYVNYLNYGYPQKANFTRIKDATFSYTMPNSLADKLKLNALTLYVTGRNLATFTNWFGWDPEANYAATGDTGGNYPLVRTFIIGANITLK